MGRHSWISVRGHSFYEARGGYFPAFAAIFRDEEATWTPSYVDADGFEHDPGLDYRATVGVIADRLDALGFTTALAKSAIEAVGSAGGDAKALGKWLAKFAVDYPSSLEDQLALLDDDLASGGLPECAWDIDPCLVLRAILEIAESTGDVALLMSEVVDLLPEFQNGFDPDFCARNFDKEFTSRSNTGPLIVITEGKSDAEILSAGLRILRPHLVGYVRFLDYLGQKPAGGAGEAVKILKSFAAAGVQNRIVAVFDNDTAATEALSSFEHDNLPATITIRRLPDMDHLTQYPTIGPTGRQSTDINGLAAGIEFYVSDDVLRDTSGNLIPVQWTGFSRGAQQYQGELLDKGSVQASIREQIGQFDEQGSVPIWPYMEHALQAILATE